METGQLAKRFLRTAGTALGSYLDDALCYWWKSRTKC